MIRAVLGKPRIDIHGCGKPSAFIQIDRAENALSLLHALISRLFMKRKQQILIQTPVKECADSSNLLHGEVSHLMQRQLRLLPRCNQAVFRILIKEHRDLVACCRVLRHLRSGKQNVLRILPLTFVPLFRFRSLLLQIDAHWHHFLYNQRLLLSNSEHVISVLSLFLSTHRFPRRHDSARS